jgi:hypothetical protein
MNKTIMLFTAMSACLDPQKLIYVAMLGFAMPIGMKIVSMLHGASDSQTFEMLSGKIGVAFILMVLCLGLAGNTAAQSGRGGECLPLILTRPITRSEYVLSKWITMTAIGGGLAALQNLILVCVGLCFGETVSVQGALCMMLERVTDAALIAAAMVLTMLNRNQIFQILSILAFYIWMTGQTIPPISMAASAGAVQDLSIESTKVVLNASQYIADLVLPTINVYDLATSSTFSILPLIAYASALTVYLTLAIHVTNRREFFYGTN